jgi:hypothetical protein
VQGGRRPPMMQFETTRQPLLPWPQFLLRLLRSVTIGLGIIALALLLGIVGYRWSGHLSWLDSLYNASMILGGMGPVDSRPVIPDAEKWFASLYALFAGVAFLVIVGVMFAPVYHRFIHRFHLELEDDGDDEGS